MIRQSIQYIIVHFMKWMCFRQSSRSERILLWEYGNMGYPVYEMKDFTMWMRYNIIYTVHRTRSQHNGERNDVTLSHRRSHI